MPRISAERLSRTPDGPSILQQKNDLWKESLFEEITSEYEGKVDDEIARKMGAHVALLIEATVKYFLLPNEEVLKVISSHQDYFDGFADDTNQRLITKIRLEIARPAKRRS